MDISVLDDLAIRSSEDAFVDRLFADAPKFGAPFLAAVFPRAYVDLNRSVDERDPALIDGIRKGGHNPRIAAGLGVIPRVVSNGQSIYRGKLPLDVATARLTNIWHPYHDQLQELLDNAHSKFGEAILLDCHSMPHEAIDAVSSLGGRRADIVLGDRFGAAAGSHITEKVEAAFRDAGLVVARNAPFAGAYTTQHYGRPSRQQHVIQVEIDRGLYMNERLVEPSADYPAFKALISGVIQDLVEIGRTEIPLAAE